MGNVCFLRERGGECLFFTRERERWGVCVFFMRERER